jgi:hypothetical protein
VHGDPTCGYSKRVREIKFVQKSLLMSITASTLTCLS